MIEWRLVIGIVIGGAIALVGVWLGAKLVWTATGHEEQSLLFKEKAEPVEQGRME